MANRAVGNNLLLIAARDPVPRQTDCAGVTTTATPAPC